MDNRHTLKFLNDLLYSICNISILSILWWWWYEDMKCDSINFMLLFFGMAWPLWYCFQRPCMFPYLSIFDHKWKLYVHIALCIMCFIQVYMWIFINSISICSIIMCYLFSQNCYLVFNQARQPVAGAHLVSKNNFCVDVCVCVSALRLLVTSGMVYIPYDWLNKFYSCCMATVVGVNNGRGLGIYTRHGN